MLRNAIQNKFLINNRNFCIRYYCKTNLKNEYKYVEVQFTSLNSSLHEIYLRNRKKCPISIYKHYKDLVVEPHIESNIDNITSICHDNSLPVIESNNEKSDIHSINNETNCHNGNNNNNIDTIISPHIKKIKKINPCTLDMRKEFLINTSKCLDCFMLKSLCICDKIKKLYNKPFRTDVQFELYCHIKEYGRASNTGNLLSIITPNQTNITLYDSGGDRGINKEKILVNKNNSIFDNEIESYSNISTNHIENELENRIKSFSSNNSNKSNNKEKKPIVLVLYPG
jgi:hypothetical protein